LVGANEKIRETIALLRGEAVRYNIPARRDLAADLPQIIGDRVQLQQVMMNLIVNSIDAMKDVDGTREVTIKSQWAESEQLLVSVSDTGIELPPQQEGQVCDAFLLPSPRRLNGDSHQPVHH
jgi:signal transduction histidine kinase